VIENDQFSDGESLKTGAADGCGLRAAEVPPSERDHDRPAQPRALAIDDAGHFDTQAVRDLGIGV